LPRARRVFSPRNRRKTPDFLKRATSPTFGKGIGLADLAEFTGLRQFPAVLRPELMRWHLWPMDRAGQAQGVYRHSTALGLYATPRIKPWDVVQLQLEALLVWKNR